MKTLLICLCLFLQVPSSSPDCEAYYNKVLKPLDIKGKVAAKESLQDGYLFKIKQDSGKQIEVKLLKNKTGREIFWFAQPGSIIIKKSGACDIHLLTPTLDGYKGRIFDKLCD